MNHLIAELADIGTSSPQEFDNTITIEEFKDWEKSFSFVALFGQRYGQSFCNHFGIADNILYYTSDVSYCRNHIKKHYITWSGK